MWDFDVYLVFLGYCNCLFYELVLWVGFEWVCCVVDLGCGFGYLICYLV